MRTWNIVDQFAVSTALFERQLGSGKVIGELYDAQESARASAYKAIERLEQERDAADSVANLREKALHEMTVRLSRVLREHAVLLKVYETVCFWDPRRKMAPLLDAMDAAREVLVDEEGQ